MTKKDLIIQSLREAIERGEKRTRRQWVRDLRTVYPYLCLIVKDYALRDAILPQRAESASGKLFLSTRHNKSGHFSATIYIPACAAVAAGFTDKSELSFTATPGRIVIEVPK